MSVSNGNNDIGSSGNKDRRKRNILLASLAALALLSLFVLLGNPGLFVPDDSGREAEAVDNDVIDDGEDDSDQVTEEIPIEEEIVEVQYNDTNNSEGDDAVEEDSSTSSSDNGGSSGFVLVIDEGNDNNKPTVTSSPGGGGGGSGNNDNNNQENHIPRALDGQVVTDKGISASFMMNGTDGDGDDLSFNLVSGTSHGSITNFNEESGEALYTPDLNYTGTDSLTFTVSDGKRQSDPATITFIINSVLGAPVASNITASTTEDTSLLIDLIANVFDEENDVITISNISATMHGVLTDNGNGTITYTPNANFNGPDSFFYQASDGTSFSNNATVSIAVNPVNDPIIALNLTLNTPEDTPVNASVVTNTTDIDRDFTVLELDLLPSHGSLTVSSDNRTITYTPNVNYNGNDSFEYTVFDSMTNASGIVSITVSPVNDAPVIIGDEAIISVTVEEDSSVIVDIIFNIVDPDGDSITLSNITSASNGNVTDNGDGTVTYTPDANYNGPDSFEFTVSDGDGGTTEGLVEIIVNPLPDAPLAQSDSVSVDEDSSITMTLNATDPDGDPLSFGIISPPSNGEAVNNGDGTVTYTPDANYNGPDSFTFQASDGLVDSNVATVSITVNPVNDDPDATNDAESTDEDASVIINVLDNDNDPDGDPLSVVHVTDPSNGNVTDNGDGTVTYTPSPDFNGTDSFEYTVSDGNGGEGTATVAITVISKNDAPVAHDDMAFTTLEAPVLVNVLANDTDIDSSTLSIASFSQPAHGTVTLSQDGKALIYTPESGFGGASDQFTYNAKDGNGAVSNTATVSVFVYNARFGHLQPPVGGGGNHEFEQGNTASIRFKLFDENGQEITNATSILRVQQLDNDNNPIGPIMDATSAGGSNDGNEFRYSNSFYQYNLKTDDMDEGPWALYVYLIDLEQGEILMEDAPIDGISATIVMK